MSSATYGGRKDFERLRYDGSETLIAANGSDGLLLLPRNLHAQRRWGEPRGDLHELQPNLPTPGLAQENPITGPRIAFRESRTDRLVSKVSGDSHLVRQSRVEI
jgi:hypothetical protein